MGRNASAEAMTKSLFETDAQTRRRMQGVRVRDTDIERVVRSVLHGLGYRFTLRREDLPGKPDVVMPKYRTVIFVNGCFWHGHDACTKGTRRPRRNAEAWQRKIQKNVAKDVRVTRELEALGWTVVTIWECETKSRATLAELLSHRLGEIAVATGVTVKP